MHHSKPNSSRRRKKADLISENVEFVTDSFKFNNKACEDHIELSHAGKMETAEVQREAKKGRGKKYSHGRSKKLKAHEVAFKYHSLHAATTTTKLLFKKEKSFNDAVQKSIESKNKVDERQWERKQNHRIQRSCERDIRKFDKYGQREGAEQQNATLLDNSQEAKERREESLPKDHRSTNRSPLLNTQNFTRFQEVIYCQMSHVSPPLKKYKNVAEVKYLYRRPKKRSKHDNLLAGSCRQKSVPCPKISTDFDVGRVEQDLAKLKKKRKHSESEEFAAEMSNADYKSKVQQIRNIMPIEVRKRKHAGDNMSEVNLRTEERVRGQWQQKTKSEGKHHVTRECSHSRKCSCNQHPQIDDHKIHQIVEETYMRKMQSLIDRKLSTLINKNKKIKLKEERASNTSKPVMKGRKTYKSGECVEDHPTLSTIKEDIVNEVLKRLKEEPIVVKETRGSRRKFSIDVTTANGHKDIHNGAIKVFKNRTQQHYHSRRTSDRIPSKDQAGLAKNQEDFLTLVTISPDEFPDNLAPIHKSRHNYGYKRRLQEGKTINSPIDPPLDQVRTRDERSQENHPQLRMMISYNSDSSSEQQIFSTNPRSRPPWKFAPKPDHHKISMMKPQSASDPYNKFLRSPPRTCVPEESPPLRQIFVLPESFRESQIYAHRRNFSVNGIESPIQDFKRANDERNTKKLECKIVSIIAIHPQKVRIAGMMRDKMKKYSGGRDLGKRKLCRKFKLYCKYSAIKSNASEGSLDERIRMSDRTRMVSYLSGEKTIKKQNLQNKSQRVETVVLQESKSSNKSSTPRNSHLNNTIEGFSDIPINAKNEQYFVPITGSNEFYCRLLTSSHSKNCLNTQNPRVSTLSKNTDHEIHVHCEEGKCRYHRPDQSQSEFRLLSKRNPSSKSDVVIHSGAKEVVKEIFKADPHPQSKSNRVLNNPSSSIEKRTECQITSCKKCQTIKPREGSCPEEDANPILQSVTDFQGLKIVKRRTFPVNKMDLAVGSPLPADKADLNVNPSPLANKVDLAAAAPIRTAGNRNGNELIAKLAVDVTTGENETMLPIKTRGGQKRVEVVYVRNKMSTAVSPVRVIQEIPLQVATKCSRNMVRLEQHPLYNSQQETPIQIPNLIQTASTRKLEIASVQCRPAKTRKQVKVELSSAITSRGTKTEEPALQYGQCIKVFRSATQIIVNITKKQSVQKIQTSEEAVRGSQGVAVPFGGNKISPETNKVQVKEPVDVAEVYFHYRHPLRGPNAKSPSFAIADNNPPINEGAAFRSCQLRSFALKKAAEGTSSLVSDVENPGHPNRKSKSLVGVERPLRDDTNRFKSEICCGIARFADRNEFVLDIKGETFISNDMENIVEKFTNNLNLRYTSKSLGCFPGQYVTNKLTARLGLAKDCRLINAYQKGKLYDASSRKKMKENFTFTKDMDMERESCEVRSTDNVPKHAMQTFEKSVFSLNLENVVGRNIDKTSVSVSRGSEVDTTSKLKNYDFKSEKQDGISMTVGEEQERLKVICKKLSNLKAIDDDMFQEAICTCLQFAQECSVCKNFLVLMDNIQSLFARYRSEINGNQGKPQEEHSRDIHAITEPPPPLDHRSKSEHYLQSFQKENLPGAEINIGLPSALENSSDSKGPHENSGEVNPSGIHTITELPPAPGDTLSIEEIYSACLNTFSNDSVPMTVPSDKEFDTAEFVNCGSSKKNEQHLTGQPMSCLTLRPTSSSFKFFSEDEHNEVVHGETLLVDLVKSFDYIFNINTCQYNMEMSHFAMGNSGSDERGYSTIRSGNYCPNCLVNVFERPKIAALFIPSKSTEGMYNRDMDKNIYSEEMTKSSQKYARKVREMNSLRAPDEEENTEFSLQFLLSDNESAILENRSLSTIFQSNELTENEHMAIIVKDGDLSWDVQFPEIKEVGKAPSSYSLEGWKIILYNFCLKNKSEIQLGSTLVANLMNNEKLNKVQKQPLSYNDASMEGFLKALIKAYDNEMEICNKLYDDTEFYNDLLGLIQEQKRQKKRTFFKLFSRKSVCLRRGKVDNIKSEQEIHLLKKLKIKLQSLGSNARRYFSMLAEILKVNANISHDQKIFGISDWLRRIENGEFELEQSGEDDDFEAQITHRVKNSLIVAHKMCLRHAQKQKRKLGNCEIKLLILVVMKYKFCLLCKADLIISSIGRGIISTEFQLKAAVTYLMRTHVEQINRSMFEEYCRSLNK